jgi:hypothetical protein
MDRGLENTWLMDSDCSYLMTGVGILFSKLTHLLSCVWFLWVLTCSFSVCLICVGGHSFSHSMITHELFVRFYELLDSFLCGLGRVRGHVYRVSLLVHDFFLWCFFWFFLCWSFESLSSFCSYITLALFVELISHDIFLRETRRLYFWTKICILLTLMIIWVYLCCIQVLCSQVFID